MDVKLVQTENDGDIAGMSSGLETAAYLSLFGGNDDGSDWWGNKLETQQARMERSETQELLRSLPVTTNNLRRIEEAVKRDLRWMMTERAARDLDVSVTLGDRNRVDIVVTLDGDEALRFSENWKQDLASAIIKPLPISVTAYLLAISYLIAQGISAAAQGPYLNALEIAVNYNNFA